MDQMAFRGSHARRQIGDIGGEVHLFHRPGVFDRGLVHVEEDRVFHRPQGEREAGIQYHYVFTLLCYWQASQEAGFSSAQTRAVSSTMGATVVLAMRVAGRERR